MNKSDLIAKMTERLSGDRRTAVAAVEAGGAKGKVKKPQASASGSPAGTVVVAADAAADDRKKAGKKAGKKARDQAEEKDSNDLVHG